MFQLISLREPKRSREQGSRSLNPPPLITDQEKGYCSCPPFECVCNFQHLTPSSYQQYNAHSPHSTTIYQQPQFLESYWTQEPAHAQSYPSDTNLNPQYDFANISTDLFQPEEIFQLDQPIKPDFITHNQSDIARSPPTLLDLGSGTIHREYKTEEYWQPSVSFINDDSNNSSNSRFLSSPDNSQLSLNNNVPTTIAQTTITNFMETAKENDFFPKYDKQLNSSYFSPGNMEADKSQQHSFSDIDNKMFFDENLHGSLDFQNIKQNYKQCGFETKHQDISQFIDYSVLGVYDNKVSATDSSVFNDLDFRINSYLPSNGIPYSGNESYEILPHS